MAAKCERTGAVFSITLCRYCLRVRFRSAGQENNKSADLVMGVEVSLPCKTWLTLPAVAHGSVVMSRVCIAYRSLFAGGKLTTQIAIALVIGLFSQIPVFSTDAQAKTPGARYCFYSKCHRVLTLSQTRAREGKTEWLVASHYDDCKKDRYNPCGLTSSGEPFRPGRHDNVASPIYPDGTVLLLWNPATRKSAVVRVNNAGPYWGNRKLDVSRAVAEKLGFYKRGVAKLKVEVIRSPNKAESTYKRNRTYPAVAGYIGKFEDYQDARLATAAIVAVNALAASTLALPVGAAVTAARTNAVQSRWDKLKQISTATKRKRRLALVRAADEEWNTRIASVSPSVGGKSLVLTDASAQRVLKTSPSQRPPQGVSSEGVQRLNRIQVASVSITSLVLPTGSDVVESRADEASLEVYGRRGRVGDTKPVRMLVSMAEPVRQRWSSGKTGVAMNVAQLQATETKQLPRKTLYRIAAADAERGLVAPRNIFEIQTFRALEALAEDVLEQEEREERMPRPHRDLPELPRKFARAMTIEYKDWG